MSSESEAQPGVKQTENTSKLRAWIGAMRLRTLPLALSSVLMGNTVALYYDSFSFGGLGRSLLTATLLQILSNFANDYGDTQNGADDASTGRTGPRRAVQSGLISPQEMKLAVIITAIASFLSGLWLLDYCIGVENIVVFMVYLLLGLGAIAAAIKYTMGKNPYGYRGLGDLFVFLFFGVVGVFGTAALMMGPYAINYGSLWGVLFIGSMSVQVLHLNNIRDMESDAKAGKRSLALILGYKSSLYYLIVLVLLAFLSAIVLGIILDTRVLLLPLIFYIREQISTALLPLQKEHQDIKVHWNYQLKFTAIMTAVITLTMFANVLYDVMTNSPVE